MKFIFTTINVLVVFNFGIIAQELKINDSDIDLHTNLKNSITLSLQYLQKTQRQQTSVGHWYKGEWPTQMCMERGFLLLGKKKEIEDSNCFGVASIHNTLAQIYLANPEYSNIPDMLDLSFQKILDYKNEQTFNFWNLLPPNRKLKKGDVIGKQPLVRRPTNYDLRTGYINKAANVVDDADDTSLGLIATNLRKRIKEREHEDDTLAKINYPIAPIFDKYRDQNRANWHWYNYLHAYNRHTGAYMTWLGQEYQFEEWSVVKGLLHNAIFYLPISECYPHPYKSYIPYGSNDVDGVVNANVLYTLSLYNELNAKGVEPAIKYIERKCKSRNFDRVGSYYPNRYQFPYAVTQAYTNGVDQLEKSVGYLVKYLLETQDEDGGWSSRRVVSKRDRLQSTAYCLNALVNSGDIEGNKTKVAIEKAIKFLQNKAITDADGLHWKGGVFFSGGTVVRNHLVWKSDAYTTVIITNAFTKYKKYLEKTTNQQAALPKH